MVVGPVPKLPGEKDSGGAIAAMSNSVGAGEPPGEEPVQAVSAMTAVTAAMPTRLRMFLLDKASKAQLRVIRLFSGDNATEIDKYCGEWWLHAVERRGAS